MLLGISYQIIGLAKLMKLLGELVCLFFELFQGLARLLSVELHADTGSFIDRTHEVKISEKAP